MINGILSAMKAAAQASEAAKAHEKAAREAQVRFEQVMREARFGFEARATFWRKGRKIVIMGRVMATGLVAK